MAGCLRSWTFLHNETINIYSHVVGALAFLTLLPAYHLIFSPAAAPAPRRWEVATAGDLLACGTYLAGVAACFVLSAAFHTLMAHSEALYLAGMKLDLQGVLLLMWGATVPLVRYTFPCDDDDARTRWAYGVGLAGLAGLCSAATFLPRFSGPRMGPWRAVLFGVFGAASFALPIAHGALRYGLGDMAARTGLGWVGATVMWNGLGVGVYAMKVSRSHPAERPPRRLGADDVSSVLQFPERWCPRRFDLFGASHQLMHICVVVAALTYTCAVVQMFDYHHNQETKC